MTSSTGDTPVSKYPLSEKLLDSKPGRDVVHSFLAFMRDQKIVFASRDEDTGELYPYYINENRLWFLFIGIDEHQLERERSQILQDLQKDLTKEKESQDDPN